ncbi:MAG: discoidin domain-containing protein [Phycisphaerae bacterium]|jgi:hypothetical protein|nr:discoidin domain-containing protein [Phycisphaerae bacterium]
MVALSKRLVVILVLAAFCAPVSAAVKSDYIKSLEQSWLKSLKPKKNARRRGRQKVKYPQQDAYGAVNGKRYERTGFHTNKEKIAWWQVDLQKSYTISVILIANREKDPQRANKLEVLLSGDGKTWTKAYTHNGSKFEGGRKKTKPLMVKLGGLSARYIRLQVRNNFLHLNEVEVYPTGGGKGNVALKKPATQSSISKNSTLSLATIPKIKTAPKPAGAKDVIAKDTNIIDALALADKTLVYVQKSKKLPACALGLKALHKKWDSKAVKPAEYDDFYLSVRHLRRKMILSHPALDFERILINRNPPTRYSHNGDQHLGRHSRIGKGLTILSDWKSDNIKVAPMLKKGMLPEGAVRNPDLHYDAKKVAFAFCDHTREGQKRYFLYEAALDGSSVRQLTGTKRDKFNTWDNRATVIIEDNDPCYLPDDEIIFITTRCQSFGRCHGGRYNPAWNLHRCDKNGDNIKQLSFANENEYEPSVLNDGRIVFTRWEYTNRHEMFFHMLWACRPDGTNVTHFFGNDMLHPMMMVEATAIPGTHRVATTAQGHHSYNTGTTVILDTNIGENTEEAIEHITPETPYSESPGGGWPNPHYSHPYPINAEMFLASRANHNVHPQGRTPPPADRAIYLIDPSGGREMIYEDPEVASFSPIAIRKRKRPPVMPTMVRPDAPDYGTVFLQNAYLTRKENDPKGIIKPGMIKAIRVIAIGVQPRARRAACNMQVRVEIPKKVIGTVPVDATGSAYFKVPARTSLQVQTLDENGMAILTEKSLFYLQPGENRSCVGCHEPEGSSPIVSAMAKLRRLRPVDLKPAAGPDYAGGLSFMRTVQPVLDRYCIKCHGLGEGKDKKGEKTKLIHDGQLWPQSYKAIFAHGDHRVGDKGYMGGSKNHQEADRNISKPRRFFAYSNKVAHMLVKNHGKCNMDNDSYMRIIEWMDVNAQCYGDLFPNKLEERKIDAKAVTALRAYVKELFGEKIAKQPDRALINVAQIDESRILMAPLASKAGGWGQIRGYASKSDPKYKKMAALVDKCIIRSPNENRRGWQPTLQAGGGEKWVIDERAKLINSLKGSSGSK